MSLGDEGAIWMTGVLNEAVREGIPEEWRTSTITPIYKQKGDPLECNNFRGITLLSHTLKLWGRVVESRLGKMVNISERQYVFKPGKSTIQLWSNIGGKKQWAKNGSMRYSKRR